MRWIPSPNPLEARSPVTQRVLMLLAAIVFVQLILAWNVRIPALSWGEDDAAYLQLAQQLRQFSYREIHDIAAPIHARFPPGYPLILALFAWPFGDALDALLGINTILSVATTVLLYLTARRHLGEGMALVLAALFAVNPMTMWDSGHVMAEASFKFLMMLGLWALTREDDGAQYPLLAGGAIIAAALTRSAGLFVIPAIGAYWIVTRRYRRAAWFAVASLLTVGVWLGWTVMAPDPENRRLYVADLGVGNPNRGRFDFLREMLWRLPNRLRRLGTVVFPTVLSLPVVSGTVVDNAAWLAVMALFGGTGTVILLRRWTAAALITISYGVLLIIWRYAEERFANPLVPFLFAAMLVGGDWLVRRTLPSWRLPVLGFLVALLLLGAARSDAVRWANASACDRANPVFSEGCWNREYRSYLRAAAWARDSTPSDAVFFVNKERGFYQHSARRTINQDRTLQEDSLSLAGYLRLRGARYTVAAPVGLRAEQHNWLLAMACRDFVVLRTFPERTAVMRLREPGDDASDDRACRFLAPYRAFTPDPE